MLRKDLMDRVGPWPAPAQVYWLPSQAWLFRAWRSGAVLRFIRTVGVVLVSAGRRPGSYVERHSPEHEWLVEWIKSEPRYRERILEDAAVSEAEQHLTNSYYAPGQALRRLLLRPVHLLLIAAGIHPRWFGQFIRDRRRVGTLRYHRQLTGSPLATEGVSEKLNQ
jgi:hypothetical protein